MANTYNKIFTRGTASELNSTPVDDGKLRLTTDTEDLFFDVTSVNKRIRISDFITNLTEAQIKQLANPLSNKFYFASDTLLVWYYVNNKWEKLSSIGHLRYATQDFTISTNWIANTDTSTNGKYPYKQLISSNLFNAESCCDSEILAGNPKHNPTLVEELNAGYIRGYAIFDTTGITLLASDQTTVNLTLRVVMDPTTTSDYDFGLIS